MIRYRLASLAEIQARVDAKTPTWRDAARLRTREMMADGRYSAGPPSWSDVKHAFMSVQYSKCIYCERPLGSSIEQDVEHFRPKNPIKAWPRRTERTDPRRYGSPTGGDGPGYFWLAYDLGNYAASCKDCNTIRKSNYFPIAGAERGAAGTTIEELNGSERPLLVFPLGEIDDDPEDLIAFSGITAVPRHASGHSHARALVTIEFFELNTREELISDRFRAIREVFFALGTLHNSKQRAQVDAAKRALGDLVSDAAAQASCARCFLRLFESDPNAGWLTYCEAEQYVGRRHPRNLGRHVRPRPK